MPRSVASDLGLCCLHMPILWDARLKWIDITKARQCKMKTVYFLAVSLERTVSIRILILYHFSTCATSEDSDQTAHPRSLIRVFADRMRLVQPPGYPKRDKREPLPYGVDVQAVLNLCWSHRSCCIVVDFVVRWLIYFLKNKKKNINVCCIRQDIFTIWYGKLRLFGH